MLDMPHYVCPLCRAELQKGISSYSCKNGHSFDISASGYVNLLLSGGKSHGDDADMVAARRRFLSGGYYDPLCDCICRALSGLNVSAVLDSGCGEGYYTSAICQSLPSSEIYGLDISKKAAEKAAKKCKNASICVCSAYNMPFSDSSFDCIINVFSPLALDEYKRVLKPGGYLVMAAPLPEHLLQLKRAVYENVRVKQLKDAALEGFELIKEEKTVYNMNLDKADIADLFMMTPYYHKTSRSDADRLRAYEKLDITAAFIVFVYRSV